MATKMTIYGYARVPSQRTWLHYVRGARRPYLIMRIAIALWPRFTLRPLALTTICFRWI